MSQINLAPRGRIYADTGAYKVLGATELTSFSNGDTTFSGVSVSSETMAIVCDLGARFKLDEVRYHYTEAITDSILVQGRQGSAAGYPWYTLGYSVVAGVLSVPLSPSVNKYRYVRVEHAVTAGTSTVYELELLSDDVNSGYGLGGDTDIFAVCDGASPTEIEVVPVYNKDTVPHTVYCLLDAKEASSAALRIGTASGTLYGLYETGISVPVDFTFSAGTHDNTSLVSGTVELSVGDLGHYYTPVLDVSSLVARRLFFAATATGTGTIDDTSVADSALTVAVRHSRVMPSDAGWVSGQSSSDSNWSVVSGTLPFYLMENGRILDPTYATYLQMRVTFNGVGGIAPALVGAGIEEGHSLYVPSGGHAPLYVQSSSSAYVSGRQAAVVTWYTEARNGIV